MKRLLMTALALCVSSSLEAISAAQATPEAGTPAWVNQPYGKLPLSFEANRGQTDARVQFLSRGRGYTLFLTATEVTLVFTHPPVSGPSRPGGDVDNRTEVAGHPPAEPSVLRVRLAGADPSSQAEGLEELPGKINYLIGSDAEKWRTNIPHYARVRYRDVYPGVDVVYYGTTRRELEYDFVVAPGADHEAIALIFEGVERVEVDDGGDLRVGMGSDEIRFRQPLVYQEHSGTRRIIPAGYVLKGARQVGFEVAHYDVSQRLVIDPVMTYSTFLGGTGNDRGNDIAVDANRNAYVVGETQAVDLPTLAPPGLNPFQGARGGDPDVPSSDAFVTKVNAAGNGLVYLTYLGGGAGDFGLSIDLDAEGNAYVTGFTASDNFPTFPIGNPDPGDNAFQPNRAGANDAFVTKLSVNGDQLVYSTYLGGLARDRALSIAVFQGDAFVVGQTLSRNDPGIPGDEAFPTQNAFQDANAGRFDAFVARLDADGRRLIYSTYLGGREDEVASAIAVNALGEAYVTGTTNSADVTNTPENEGFPTTENAFQRENASNTYDAFVTKLSASGEPRYSTYLGGTGPELYGSWGCPRCIDVDDRDNAYVTGNTSSLDDIETLNVNEGFPTVRAFQGGFGGGGRDVFVAKIDPNLVGMASLVNSTYLGGLFEESVSGIVVDTAGNPYITGESWGGFPGENNALNDEDLRLPSSHSWISV